MRTLICPLILSTVMFRLTNTLSRVSDKIRHMENNLNHFTEEHDQDHAGLIKKKWEEHNKASVFFDDQDSAYSSGRQTNLANQDPLSRPNDNLDQDLSNGHVEAHDQAGGVSVGNNRHTSRNWNCIHEFSRNLHH